MFNVQMDKEIVDYFTNLGYTVTWDFSRKSGEYWYEILDECRLVSQIDMNIPLKYIVQDLISWYNMQPSASDSPDYKICGNGPLFKQLLEKVYQHENP